MHGRGTPVWRHMVAVLQSARAEYARGSRTGIVGYSMGGHWALWLSSQARAEVPEISATVVYYATRACDFHASTAAFQLHLAETDPFVSASSITAQLVCRAGLVVTSSVPFGRSMGLWLPRAVGAPQSGLLTLMPLTPALISSRVGAGSGVPLKCRTNGSIWWPSGPSVSA